MKGSVMDAMSEAVDGAAVMLYGVSLNYKESANCRYAVDIDFDIYRLSYTITPAI